MISGLACGQPKTRNKTMTDEKFILDATAGFRMMWFDKNQENTVYLDKRNDEQIRKDAEDFGNNRGRKLFKTLDRKNPTVEGNFCKTPYSDESFRLIVWDPPHLIGSNSRRFQQGLTFGVLQAETWQSELTHGFLELWRLLKPYGVLIFKWHDSSLDYKRILKLFHTKPLFGQITSNRYPKSAKKTRHTFWFCFMKIPEEVRG